MSEDRDVWRVVNARVASLECECGCCGMPIEIEDEALEDGRVATEHAFGECSHCGELFDATSVVFFADVDG